MTGPDGIEIVEAAYSIWEPEVAWQHRLTQLVAAQWDGEAGSLIYDASDPENLVRKSSMVVGSEEKRAAFCAGLLVPVPAEYVREVYCKGPHFSSLYESVKALGARVESYEPLSLVKEAAPALNLDWFASGVNALDPSRRGLVFAMSLRRITPPMRRFWARIASHIGIAYRLRRELAGADGGEPPGEAVVDLDGRCQHAEGKARSTRARDSLRQAARALMRARGSLRRRDPDEALDLWRGLVDGRWSLIDRFDSDGRHYLIAHRNPPAVRDPRALTAREAQIAAYCAMALANKTIGYNLGLDASTVGFHIASIRRKLGVASRAELVSLLAALEPGPAPRQAED